MSNTLRTTNTLRTNTLRTTTRRPIALARLALALFTGAGLAIPCTSAAEPPAEAAWQDLFDNKSLSGWKVIEQGDFEKSGGVEVRDGALVLAAGKPATGIRWTKKFPRSDFELAFEARRVAGDDFFGSVTFPVGDGSQTLVVGGWGGWVVGLSCIDDRYAINNDSCRKVEFENGRWYGVRVRVTQPRIDVWVDDQHLIKFDTAGHRFAVSEEMAACVPVGFATWKTTGAVRKIRYRKLTAAETAIDKTKP